ncbi:SPOP protein, partial [Acromyrmex insinuator]
ISDKKEDENLSKKEQTILSCLPLHFKSYAQTQIKSTKFDFTWKINQSSKLFKVVNQLCSPVFLEKDHYQILIKFSHNKTNSKTAQFFMCTDKPFIGICTITLNSESPKSFFGRISNMTLLIEISEYELFYDMLTIYFEFEIFHKLKSNILHTNLSSTSSTLFSKDIKSLEDSILNELQSKNDESINFILGKEQYVVSKKLLCATNSSYFKNICQTHEAKIDMTNELTLDELENFKILLLIINGLKSVSDYLSSDMLKKIFTIADKYDVLTVKLTCEHYLIRHIKIINAMELIEFAFSFNANFLKTYLINFVKFHIKEITNTTNFQKLPQKNIAKLMEFIEKNETLIETSTSLFQE